MAQLRMIKSSMADIPEANIASGFELRLIRAGEQDKWEKLCGKAFDGEFSFETVIAGKAGYTEDGVFVVTCEDESKFVATGTALLTREQPEGYGYVHMIAADPDYSGRKLGYEVTAAVLRRLRDAGFEKAELETDDFRLPAIKIYLDLGFAPDLSRDETMPGRWDNIYKALANN